MCGIVGYVGPREAAPILLDGLKRLEYRGYDSAGMAVMADGAIGVLRSMGRLANLDALAARSPLKGYVGLGHTRWATHGIPSEANAHPHSDCSGRLVVIHNGIIENYMPLKASLLAQGHLFKSSTDTEVAAHLVEEELKRLEGSSGSGEDLLLDAVRAALKSIRGSYALAVMWSSAPGVIVAAKSDSPLVIGIGRDEVFLASDVPAFLKHTRKVVYLEDGELAVVGGKTCSFFTDSGAPIEKAPSFIEWDSAVAEKGGYRHFMLKEIHEQPRVAEETLRGRLLPLNGSVLERETGISAGFLQGLGQMHIVACGTSWHAGIIGKYLIERYARLQVSVETASEFRYRKPVMTPDSLLVAISQSGETADTLAAVRQAKQMGAKVLSICNTMDSAIPRSSDFKFYTACGPECGVASTKAFVGQLLVLNVIALHLAVARGKLAESEALEWVVQLQRLPELLTAALALEDQVRRIAEKFSATRHFLYIGRGINYPTALEGALKLKEISYIHAEGYPAGEMKHGPLALVDSEMPVVAIATASELFEKTLSNIEEAKARGAKIIALCTQGETRLDDKADHVIAVPACSELVSPIVNIVPLQLLAYHCADIRGCDVDHPRNLAKSVTVE